jgi:hypothetical protein
MKELNSNKKSEQVPAERSQGSEFNPDREESPSADWIQHSNEETVIYSQHGKPATITVQDKNPGKNNDPKKSSGK